MAASVTRGILAVSSAKKTIKKNKVKAWVIPDRGVFAPILIFAAVLAMAPVTGIPPNMADPIFAMPCANNSVLERWRLPVILSATEQERTDSIDARRATVRASGK